MIRATRDRYETYQGTKENSTRSQRFCSGRFQGRENDGDSTERYGKQITTVDTCMHNANNVIARSSTATEATGTPGTRNYDVLRYRADAKRATSGIRKCYTISSRHSRDEERSRKEKNSFTREPVSSRRADVGAVKPS